MGRPPSNGGPSFRFNPTEVAEMEAILQAHNTQVPSREILVSLAEKFSNSSDRFGKVVVQMKQVWNWFQNRRYALRAKAAKVPAKLSASPVPSNDVSAVRNMPQAPQHMPVAPAQTIVRNVPQVLQPISSAPAVPSVGQNSSDSFLMEFEAKSARDGAWYDVATFISYRSADTTDPEVLVRFAGLGPEEDEWVNIRKHVRQRSLPCEASECVAVLPADLILCFQEGKEQALYFDAHVLDAQRRRHDVRGCRCRFLVRYDHDQSEEIVPLKKVCRRPETDYRMQQLHVDSANVNRNKANPEPHMGNTLVHPSSELSKKLCTEPPVETKDHTKAEVLVNTQPVQALITLTSACTTTAAVSNAIVGVNSAVIGTSAAQPVAPIPTSTMPIAQSNISGATVSAATTTNPDVHFSDSGATVPTVTAAVAQSITSGATLTASSPSNPVPQANASGAALSSVSTTNLASHFVDSGSTVSPVNATSTVAQNTRGATLPASTTTNATDQLIDSPATVFTVSTTPATTSVTHSISSGATSSPPAFQVIDFGANVSTVTAMPAILSTDSEASASTTTQDANSIVSESASSTVTATIPVADSDVGFTDSVITTTSVPSSNLSGASDPAVPITTPTTTTDVSGAAEGTEATLVPGSAVSEITNPVPTEKPEK